VTFKAQGFKSRVTMAADLAAAWAEVSDEKNDTNWVLYTLENKKLTLTGTGQGGLTEVVGKFQPNAIQFAGLKARAVDEGPNISSKRVRMVRLDWVGANVSPMKRAGLLQALEPVNATCKGAAVTIQASVPEDLSGVLVARALMKGDNPTYFDFGDGQRIQVADLMAK